MPGHKECSRLPIFPAQPANPGKFSNIGSHDAQIAPQALRRDQAVVGTDWPALKFKFGADVAGDLRVLVIEDQYFNRLHEIHETCDVCLDALALGDAVLKLDDANHGNPERCAADNFLSDTISN